MAASKKPGGKAAPALILTLGGAPASPHTVTGLPGLFRPDRPVPVGGPGEATLAQAKAASADPGVPVTITYVPDKDIPRLRLQAENDRRADIGLPPREEQ